MSEHLGEMQSAKTRLKERGFSQNLEAWGSFSAYVRADGVLSAKYKALIGMAVGLCKRCAPCIAYHTKAAICEGATDEEVLEAAFVAVLMEGGPAQAHLGLVLDALDEFAKFR
jgi:AhpD family alkylhydroperoxidase